MTNWELHKNTQGIIWYMVYGTIYIYMDNKYYGIWYMVYNTMVETYYRIQGFSGFTGFLLIQYIMD